MSKQNKILIAAVIIIVGILWVIGDQQEVKEDRLSSSFRSNFMEGCVGEAGLEAYDYCDCALDYLDDNYSNKVIIRESMKMVENKYYEPEIMNEAIEACLFELSY
jgi:hypothetical protein